MSLSVTRSRTFPGSRRDTIDIPKNSWPLVDAIDATSVSRPWNLPPEGGFLDGSVDGRSRKSWEGQRRRDGSRRKRTEASVVTSVAAIQEWGKSGRSGGREEWGREKAVSWSDSNRTSATSLRPRSQRLLIDHRGCQVFSIFSSHPAFRFDTASNGGSIWKWLQRELSLSSLDGSSEFFDKRISIFSCTFILTYYKD